LADSDEAPYWQRHVAAVVCAVRDVPAGQPLVMVAHSGTGPLLPAIGGHLDRPVAGYVFVDAGLPGRDGQSRLDLFDPAEAEQFRNSAIDGIVSRGWRNDDLLRALGFAAEDLRRRFAAEVPDVPLAVYEEPLPVSADWPGAPCGYLLFSGPYEPDAHEAPVRGWALRELPGGHFHMLVDPSAVADALLELASEMGM